MDTLIKWPNHLLERLLIVGLSTKTDPEQLVQEVVRDGNEGQTYTPEVLYSHKTPGSSFSSPDDFVAAFCFPYGVLSEVIPLDSEYEFVGRLNQDDIDGQGLVDRMSVFMIKAAGQPEFPLYGVCCYSMDLQQRPPCAATQQRGAAVGADAAGCRQGQQGVGGAAACGSILVAHAGQDYLVRAPRCYCLLSHYPFFELHYHALQMIIKLEKQQLLGELQAQLAHLLAPAGSGAHGAGVGGQPAVLDLGMASARLEAGTGACDTARSGCHPELDSRAASFAANSSDHVVMMQRLALLRARQQQVQEEGREGWGMDAAPSGGGSDPILATLQRYMDTRNEAGGMVLATHQLSDDDALESCSAAVTSRLSDISSRGASDQASDATSPRAPELTVERSMASMSLRAGASVRAALGVKNWAAEQQALLRQLGAGPDQDPHRSGPSATSRLASVRDQLHSGNELGVLMSLASATELCPRRSSLSVASRAADVLVQRSARSATPRPAGTEPTGAERSSPSASLRAAAAAALRLEAGGGRQAGEGALQQARASARLVEMSPRLAAIQNSLVGRPQRGGCDTICAAAAGSLDSPPGSSRFAAPGEAGEGDRSARSASGPLGHVSLKGKAQALLQQARAGSNHQQQQQQQQQQQLLSTYRSSDNGASSSSTSPGGCYDAGAQHGPPGKAAGGGATASSSLLPLDRKAGLQPTNKADSPARRIANILDSYAAIGVEDIHPSCSCLVFCPDNDLRGMRYVRPEGPYLRRGCHYPVMGRAARLLEYAEEEALECSRHWTLACLCRTLSLDNILALLSCVLREEQVVLLCPILSKLSSCMLGLLPLLQPFAWHHLQLPVTPLAPLALEPGQPPRVLGFQFLQATCPFLLGFPVTDEPALFSMCQDDEQRGELQELLPRLVLVQLLEDHVAPGEQAAYLPLPGLKRLRAELQPLHEQLAAGRDGLVDRPVHLISRQERDAAEEFLATVRRYLLANLEPQLPAEGPASCASSARDACSDVVLPSPRSMSSFTGRLRSFFAADEDRARFWDKFSQTAMAAQYHG